MSGVIAVTKSWLAGTFYMLHAQPAGSRFSDRKINSATNDEEVTVERVFFGSGYFSEFSEFLKKIRKQAQRRAAAGRSQHKSHMVIQY